jgi:hypothetical protein
MTKFEVSAGPTTDPKILAQFPDGLDFTFLARPASMIFPSGSLVFVYREGTPAGELFDGMRRVMESLAPMPEATNA